jgi:hypothetical protein
MYWAAMGTVAVKKEWPARTVVVVVAAAAAAGSSAVWTVAAVSWLVAVHAYSQSLVQDSLTVNLREDW